MKNGSATFETLTQTAKGHRHQMESIKYVMSILLLMPLSGALAQESKQDRPVAPAVFYDPAFWRAELKLKGPQLQRIDQINTEFYDSIRDHAQKDPASIRPRELEESLAIRSKKIWETLHPRQKKKWETLIETTLTI